MTIVILGLSITSSWGNGHATTYRGLVRELSKRGHKVLFLERDVPWYADNRDLPCPPYGRTELYFDFSDLTSRFEKSVLDADLTIVGSYVPEGIAIGEWVLSTARRATAFYDIDTPVTFAALQNGTCDYLKPSQVSRYDLYLSFTGGPILRRIERTWGSPCVRPFYCSFDPDAYYPEPRAKQWSLGYLGTFSADRQSKLDQFLTAPALQVPPDRFVVAGPLYPPELQWPENVDRIEHLSPSQHRFFYNSQKLTLNITRADMVRAGYSPSVRLFEAAACGTAIVSDEWTGIEEVLTPGKEILITRCTEDVLRYLDLPGSTLSAIGLAARQRVLSSHTAAHRAAELESLILQIPTETVTARTR